MLQISVSRGQKPDVDFNRFVRPDPGNLAVFQNAEQFDLRLHGHVADFVQKEGAAVGVLKLPDAVGNGVCKRAANVSKQLAFQDVFTQRAAVQTNKRFVLSGRILMYRLGDHLFPRAGFSLNEDGCVCGGDSFEPFDNLLHGGGRADDAFKPEFFV